MPGSFSFWGADSGGNDPSIGSATRARGYARHYLWNTLVFWGTASLACIAGLGLALAKASPGGEAFWAALAGLCVLLGYSFLRGARALADLMGAPAGFEGRVASRTSRLFWNKLSFLEEKYYLEIVRGPGMRPLTIGGGDGVREGWFLAARGYHDLLAPNDLVRGTIYPKTRLINTLVKV